MAKLVPKSTEMFEQDWLSHWLNTLLESVLEFTGAQSGWIGVIGHDGRLSFPSFRGAFSKDWLTKQQGADSPWGFAVREESPTLLNNLSPIPGFQGPQLKNILSCPISAGNKIAGQIVVADKPAGFASQDATVLQGIAHVIGRLIKERDTRLSDAESIRHWPLVEACNKLGEGLLILEPGGKVLFANPVFFNWVGFKETDVLGTIPPYPFWISHRTLDAISRQASSGGEDFTTAGGSPIVPFRALDDTLFWCGIHLLPENIAGHNVWVVILRKNLAPEERQKFSEPSRGATGSIQELLLHLPLAAAITNAQGLILSANSAFQEAFSLPQDYPPSFLADICTAESAKNLAAIWTGTSEETPFGNLSLAPQDAKSHLPLLGFWIELKDESARKFLFLLSENWRPNSGRPHSFLEGEPGDPDLGDGNRLVLSVQLGKEIDFWDRKWERLTGLERADLKGVPSELVLDWLLPYQTDRDQAADVLHQATNKPVHQVLHLVTRQGSQPFRCYWLPVEGKEGRQWIVIFSEEVGAPAPGPARIVQVGRPFLRGLSQLLNHQYLELANLADKGQEVAGPANPAMRILQQIQEACRRNAALLDNLQDLAAISISDPHPLDFHALLEEFLIEQADRPLRLQYQLKAELEESRLIVLANPRMVKTVLRHLLINAEQALPKTGERTITVSLKGNEKDLACSISDTGEGLPIEDLSLLATPFVSTRGAFAHDTAHAALEATGLGLTVCQHLLRLHGGRLALRNRVEGGAVATLILPLHQTSGGARSTAGLAVEPIRSDAGRPPSGPHSPAAKIAAGETPFPEG